MNPAPTPPAIPGAQRRTVTIETADAGSIDLSVVEAGAGPPTLLLHGWPQHAGCWRHVIPLLAGDLRLIAPDNRGFGWSAAPGKGYDHATFASDAVALLDALGIESVNLVGHDWGGAAAFELALAHPGRVDRMLVLNTVGPWVEPSLGALKHLAGAWYVPTMAFGGRWVARNRPEALAHGMRRDVMHGDLFTAADASEYAAVLAQPERAVATAALYRHYLRIARTPPGRAPHAHHRLTQPTHFLFGTGDRAIATAMLRGIEDHCDDLTLELTPGSGHFICEELPHMVADRARRLFLS